MDIFFTLLPPILFPLLSTAAIYFLIRIKYPNAARIFLKVSIVAYILICLFVAIIVDEKIGAGAVGLALLLGGIFIFFKPESGDLGSLNDARLKWLYGTKGYYTIMRFVSAPIFVLIGLWLLWSVMN